MVLESGSAPRGLLQWDTSGGYLSYSTSQPTAVNHTAPAMCSEDFILPAQAQRKANYNIM